MHKTWAINEGASSNLDQIYMFPPGDNRYNQVNFALVISKTKKNLDILPLKRVKLEIFACHVKRNQRKSCNTSLSFCKLMATESLFSDFALRF